MSESVEKLRQELQAARDTIAGLQAQLENRDATYRLATLELEENRSALLFMLEDLENARGKIEQSLHEWMAALDVVADPIFLHDAEFRILRCNKAYQKYAGLPFEEILGRPYYEVFPKADKPLPCCLLAMERSGQEEEEEEVVECGDLIYRSRSFPVRDGKGGYLYSAHILENITESRRTERLLRENERRLKEAQRIAHLGSWTLDLTSNELIWSDEIYRIFETDPEKFGASYEAFLNMVHPADRELVNKTYTESISTRAPYEIEHRLLMNDGRAKYVKEIGETYYGSHGEPLRSFGIVHDVTRRKQAEVALKHANRALAALSEVNRSLVYATQEEELLQSICQAIVEQRGYRLASVGYVQQDADKGIRIMAHAGEDEGYLEMLRLTWAENDYGMGPSGQAVRSGRTQLCRDMANDPMCLPWREAALQHGYAACIALPLLNEDGTVFGILNVHSGEVEAFTPDEIKLLEEMAGDLAFGVRSLKLRQERDQALEQNRKHLVQLQDNLEEAVRAMAAIVEMRDPYTAGHQSRVADLAAAIARQMGLPEDEIHGIHLAGVLHDLGKIRVPAEILSKPGRISEAERSLISIHPQAGYDILQGISFPWPIAQMVLQHHERLDGSGYPQGLKGEEISLGARILSVADVVEAMSSHRPYRPGLGIEAALEEITGNRGLSYDPRVVDACLVLFREQGYQIGGVGVSAGRAAGGAVLVMEWNESLSMGVPEIDREHRNFIKLVNALYEAILKHMDQAEIMRRMQGIVADTEEHFEHEEAMFREWGYPGTDEHVEKHRVLLDELRGIMGRIKGSLPEHELVAAGLKIKELLLDHLLLEDMKYRDYRLAQQPSSLAIQQ